MGDNRFGLVVVMVGISFVLWLHNTDRLPRIMAIIKEGTDGGGLAPGTGTVAPVTLNVPGRSVLK